MRTIYGDTRDARWYVKYEDLICMITSCQNSTFQRAYAKMPRKCRESLRIERYRGVRPRANII